MTQDAAPDEPADPRLSARLSAVLGIAAALLLAMLPGIGLHGARPLAALGAAQADQPLLAAADRPGEARAALDNAREPKARRPDFGDTPMLLAGALAAAFLLLAAASLRPPLARAQPPRRRPSTARARAPPRA